MPGATSTPSASTETDPTTAPPSTRSTRSTRSAGSAFVLHRFRLLDEEPVETSVTIGPAARRPLRLDSPVFVSDLSFGALSQEAKTALARGAEGAGTGDLLRRGRDARRGEGRLVALPVRAGPGSLRLGRAGARRGAGAPPHARPGRQDRYGGHLPGPKVVGRDGGTGAAPTTFRDTISVPTMAALARARRHLDGSGAKDVTLVATGGLRTPHDVVKALALGADAVAVSNVALQAVGCVGMRACHTDNCPVGIATQKPHLRARFTVDRAAEQLTLYLESLTHLLVMLPRARGHRSLGDYTPHDLTRWKREVADLRGVTYAGVSR